MTTSLKRCRHGRTHDDGLALVEYIMARGGKVEKTNEAIAAELGMLKNLGNGIRQIDNARFVQARNHVKDGTDPDGSPCCQYRLHYRASGRRTEFALIDPTGDLGPHVIAAIESVRGWMTREAQHKTENARQVETWERLADHALARGDKAGYRICVGAAVELDRDGTVSPKTMAEAAVWIDAIRAAEG